MKLSIVTAVYPAVIKYLGDFFNSLKNQIDQDYTLWIGLDEIDENEILLQAHAFEKISFVKAPFGTTPTTVRNYVLNQALKTCDAVALVDADDMLKESRIKFAKKFITKFDVVASGMKYVDAGGNSITGFFEPSLGDPWLIKNNVFGFSNTTWKSDILAKFIPIPDQCVLMDWYVATLALYSGASLGYETEPRMLYRQHPGNIAMSRAPFSAEQIFKAVDLVLGHFDLVLNAFAERGIPGREKFEQARERVQRFGQAIQNQTTLEQYITSLNALPNRHAWWSCVAHPELEKIWE